MARFLHIRKHVGMQGDRRFGLLLRSGGHGPYAAGYIDALLEGGVCFDAISAAGAGAVNASVLAFGLAQGGQDTARRALRGFWRVAGRQTDPEASSFADCPAQIEAALTRIVDFAQIRASARFTFFVAAGNAMTEKPRLFSKHEVGIDVVMAAVAPLALARNIDGDLYCAVGVHEELAVLPLSADHRAQDVVAPFRAPSLRERNRQATAQQHFEVGRTAGIAWLAALARPSRHPQLPTIDHNAPLAA